VAYQQNGALVVGTVFHFMKSDFSGLSFYVRGDVASSGLVVRASSQPTGVSTPN
jgi:hypothetical protein